MSKRATLHPVGNQHARNLAGLMIGFALLAGCTMVHLNGDATNSITYTGDADVGRDYAMRACRKGSQNSVEVVSIKNKDESLPPGQGRQIITFKCSAKPPKPPGAP
jgi:hypothetical protein